MAIIGIPMVALTAVLLNTRGAIPPPAFDGSFPPLPSIAALPAGTSETGSAQLPLVSGAARPASRRYQALRAGDARGALEMFEYAWAPLATQMATPAARRSADRFRSSLLFKLNGSFDKATFQSTVPTIVVDLALVAGNAEHLSDLAVALFLLGEATGRAGNHEDSQLAAPSNGARYNSAGDFESAALILLELSASAFPMHSAINVNLAFFRDLRPPRSPEQAIDDLRRYLERRPDDLDGRLLLASLQSRRWDRDGLTDAIATLSPIVSASATENIARLALGDAYVASVDRFGIESPERTRRLLKTALAEYDRVLVRSGFTSALVGRAVALDLLGDRTASLLAMERAASADQTSAVRRLELAKLRGCAGDQRGRLTDAEVALKLLAGRPGAMLSDRRMVPGSSNNPRVGVDRGYAGISNGSDRIPWTATSNRGAGGGGYIVDISSIASAAPCLTPESAPLADQALDAAVGASIALGQPDASARVLDKWGYLGSGRATRATELIAAQMVAGTIPGKMDDAARAAVRAASELYPADAADLCRRILVAAEGVGDKERLSLLQDRLPLLACVVSGSARAGDTASVDWAVQRIALRDAVFWKDATNALMDAAEYLRMNRNRLDDAAGLFRIVAQDDATRLPALAHLGDVMLDGGDASAAIAYYDLALAAVDVMADDLMPENQRRTSPAVRRIEQLLHNNRGIARLIAARPRPDDAPQCLGVPNPCRLALKDFELAVASNAENWVYLMNEGWAARLLGDNDRAESRLRGALDLKPDLAPALNDLAVLEARRGARGSARDRLELAVAVDPSYDLAKWNLGVLESGEPTGLIRGQASLTSANMPGTKFRAQPFDFRTDESVYRVTAETSGELRIDRATSGPALGASAFGVVVVAGGIAKLAGAVRGPAQDSAVAAVQRRLKRPLRRLYPFGRVRLALRRRGLGWWRWIVWIPILLVLCASTFRASSLSAADAVPGAFVLALLASGAAVWTHLAGHQLLASPEARLQPSRSGRSYIPLLLAAVGLTVQVPAGPYPDEIVVGRDAGRAWAVSLAGPLANLAAAAVAYVLFTILPVPFLRQLATVQLAVAAYALMPIHPLDGSRLANRHGAVLVVIGLVIVAASAALSLGVG